MQVNKNFNVTNNIRGENFFTGDQYVKYTFLETRVLAGVVTRMRMSLFVYNKITTFAGWLRFIRKYKGNKET